ncbi:PREDICTED: ankyrin repeat domain-containing protein 17-like [Amphimedon queenslandica]|uniref:Uncharacterized protein n=1 Tax=Amphimedon queenslandica TaxID=400682 RepID=A0AAN0JSV8_AMPQE|nr:PREDICTED: ankyrin repeat domain-containing protein 17-like [Amphimedon queenslandica]|eukprot:XP_019859901.1 PREDICTED: ankyrin repeat domain-containing protein 17-like [Amphimedon queenslandica]
MITCCRETDNLEIVQLLLEAGADPNIKGMNEITALACAVMSGNKIIVHELLTAGANNINIVMNWDDALIEVSIIHLCVSKLMHKSDFEFVQSQSLSEVLAEKYENNEQIFEVASKFTVDDTIEILRLLLEATPQPEDDPASLILASLIGNVQAVELLLKVGYDCKAPLSSSKFFSAILSSIMEQAPLSEKMLEVSCPSLVTACIRGHLEVVKALLRVIHDLNHQQKTGETFLMLACESGHKDIILTLLENGADTNTTDSKGRTALMLASIKGQSEAVALLLMTYNTDSSVSDNYGSTALCYAAYGGCTEESINLLAENIIITNRQKDILTACISDDITLFVQARPKQASSDLCAPLIESTGLTPLMIAASCGSDGVVQTLLLVHGADVNQQDTYLYYSPLLYAVQGSKSIVQYLLDSGANVNDISKQEETPLDIARDKGLNDIAQLLESNGGKTYSSLKAIVEKVTEQLRAKQKAEVLQKISMQFSQMQMLSTAASMRESFHVPLFTSIPILPTIMIS